MHLTDDIANAVTEQGRPVAVTDAAGHTFVVMTERQFREYVYDDAEFEPGDAYALAEETFAEGWNAPGMEAYDEDSDPPRQSEP